MTDKIRLSLGPTYQGKYTIKKRHNARLELYAKIATNVDFSVDNGLLFNNHGGTISGTINDKKVLILLQDYTQLNDDRYVEKYREETDTVLMAQLKDFDLDRAMKIYEKFGLKIHPIPFPASVSSTDRPLEKRHLMDGFLDETRIWQNTNKKYLCNFFFNSSHRRHRIKWLKYARDTERKAIDSGAQKMFEFNCVPHEDYARHLCEDVKWGFILIGRCDRSAGGKNHRESIFISLGMPLMLSHTPFYPFHFEKNVHYLHVRTPEEAIDRMINVDPEPFAQKSRELWTNYFSPNAYFELLNKLVLKEEYDLDYSNM